MSRVNIGMLDRISDEHSKTQRRLVSKSEAGFVTARIGSENELHETFTHQQIRDLVAANIIRIDRGWFEEGRARARLMAGVNSLTEVPIAEANQMLSQQYYIDEFLKREGSDKSVKRTDACIARTLEAIDAARPNTAQRWDQKQDTPPKRPSARTFRRWLRVYEDNGFDILSLRKRYRNSGCSISPMHPEADRILRQHVMSYCDERRKPMSKIHGEMKAEFSRINQERDALGQEALICPAKSTLSVRIHALNQFEVYASRYGLAKARVKFAIIGAGLDVTRPLQHVQIDEWTIQLHTIADQAGLGGFLTEKDRIALKKQRMRICVVIDVATRCILAMWLSPKADSKNIISALAMAVSDKTEIARASGCESDWPMGGPFVVISPDAGSGFVDKEFRGCIANLKAVYENAPARLSMMRGHIERLFGSMHTSLMPNFPGRSFSNVVDLGQYEAEHRAAVFTKMLPKIFVRWAVDWYHHTPHAGLGGETPYCAWQRLTAQYGIDPSPNAHQRREIFGVDLERSLDQRGVRVVGVYYQSPELQEWRRQVGDTNVRVRFDAADIGHVSVWLGERWLTVPSVREMHRGICLETWLESVKDLKRRHAASAKIYEHIAMAAVRAISTMADDAMRRVSIDATRPTAAQLAHEERHLLLGFEVIDDIAVAELPPKTDLLSGGIPVASAATPIRAVRHPQSQVPVSGDADEFGLED